jgi:hypothetical protein
MENFFKYISQPATKEDIEDWLRANNIVMERVNLFHDFIISLNDIVNKTYLGGENDENEIKIQMTENDIRGHFDWCILKVIKDFNKESIYFRPEEDYLDFMFSFYKETFYNQTQDLVRNSLGKFFDDLFNLESMVTRSDLDMLITIYRGLNKNMTIS